MTETLDFKILELMASKICHDLISPVGAVSNGVEFLEEMGADAGEEVTGLISFSAAQAASKLKAMRVAYGAGGADSSIKLEDIHKIFGDYISGEGKITQNWDPYAPLGRDPCPHGFSKVLINLLMLACEALPKGGTITVQEGTDGAVIIEARGENANFRDGVVHAIANTLPLENMEPRLVHAWLCGAIVKNYGFEVATDNQKQDLIVLRFS